jgi:lysylphosphatidylglycerol synthetase-like protein (DUF2156 family)
VPESVHVPRASSHPIAASAPPAVYPSQPVEANQMGSGTYIVHPNREKAASQATKATVTLLLIAVAVLFLIITVGGWQSLEGVQIISIGYALVCLLMAYYCFRWNRGVLPVSAGLAIIFCIVAIIAAPRWFDRDHAGYTNPGLPPSLLGLLTVILVPVEILLIIFAMRGFSQKWNIEVEITRDEYESGEWRQRDLTGDTGSPQGSPARS